MLVLSRICCALLLGLGALEAAHADDRDAADKIVMRPVVIDAEGRLVGVYVPTFSSFGVYFRAGGRPVTVGLVPTNAPEYRFTFRPTDFLVFSETDCQGKAYISVDSNAIGPGFPGAVIDREQRLLLYVSDSLEGARVDYKSFFQNGTCFGGGGTDTFFPAAGSPVDLTAKFRLPLRIR